VIDPQKHGSQHKYEPQGDKGDKARAFLYFLWIDTKLQTIDEIEHSES